MENMETENIFSVGDWVIPNDQEDLLDHMVYRLDSITKHPDYFETFYNLINYYLVNETKIITKKVPYTQSEMIDMFIKVEKPEWVDMAIK